MDAAQREKFRRDVRAPPPHPSFLTPPQTPSEPGDGGQGWLVVRGAIPADKLAALNALYDERLAALPADDESRERGAYLGKDRDTAVKDRFGRYYIGASMWGEPCKSSRSLCVFFRSLKGRLRRHVADRQPRRRPDPRRDAQRPRVGALPGSYPGGQAAALAARPRQLPCVSHHPRRCAPPAWICVLSRPETFGAGTDFKLPADGSTDAGGGLHGVPDGFHVTAVYELCDVNVGDGGCPPPTEPARPIPH